MIYKGYTSAIEFDEKSETFFGKVVDIKDVITFQAESVEGLKNEFKNSIDDYIEFCKQKKREPEKPYTGKFNIRINPDLHRKLQLKQQRNTKA